VKEEFPHIRRNSF